MSLFEPHTPGSRVLRWATQSDEMESVDLWEDVPGGWRIRLAHYLETHNKGAPIPVRACYVTYRDETIEFERDAITLKAEVASGPGKLVVHPRRRLRREELVVDDFSVTPQDKEFVVDVDCLGEVDERVVDKRFHLVGRLDNSGCPCCS